MDQRTQVRAGSEVGDEVWVFDRYRLATPHKGKIRQISDSNSGIRVELDSPLPNINNDEFWVDYRQTVPAYEDPEPRNYRKGF